jgi:hypothetical protein
LEVRAIGKDFLSRTTAVQQLRERRDKWDYMKLKNFCTTKEEITHRVGENICQLYFRQRTDEYTGHAKN